MINGNDNSITRNSSTAICVDENGKLLFQQKQYEVTYSTEWNEWVICDSKGNVVLFGSLESMDEKANSLNQNIL